MPSWLKRPDAKIKLLPQYMLTICMLLCVRKDEVKLILQLQDPDSSVLNFGAVRGATVSVGIFLKEFVCGHSKSCREALS